MPNTPGVDRARRRAKRAGTWIGVVLIAVVTLAVFLVIMFNR
jgi:hypothetical protein